MSVIFYSPTRAYLAAIEDESMSDFTMEQISRFHSMSNRIQEQFDYPILKHILNSAGISQYPNYQMEMVRLGLGLYGLSPIASEQKNLYNINRLKTTITQIKNIKSGDSVGYNRSFIADSNMRIATIPIGYADGIQRYLGKGKYKMIIHDQLAPTVGNICMDMCMLDVTHIDCKEGDEVIIFENQDQINEIANIGQTIPYEILTGISQRVKRIYFKE